LTFSQDGKHLLAGDSNGEISIYDFESNKEILAMKAHKEGI
jgi:WD40 repeat protein